MSADTYRIRYGNFRVNGSAAYDFDAVRELDHRQSIGVEPRRQAAVEKAPKERISPLNMLCVVIVMALLVVMINSYVMLSKTTTETVELNNEITQLREQERQLRAHKQMDLAAIETYATEELGMVSLNSDKVVYVDVSGEDRAVLSGTGTSTMNTTGFFARILEYFR